MLASGCVDLTEPWKRGGTGGSLDAGGVTVASDGAASLDGGGGTSGTGGGPGMGGATASDGGGAVIDGALGGSGGVDGAGVLDVNLAEAGAQADVPLGTGGAGAGGATGSDGKGAGGGGGKGMGGGGGKGTGGGGGKGTGGSGGKGTGGSNGSGGATGRDAPPADAQPDSITGTDSPLAIGLVLYYPCERANGVNLPDESGAGNDGKLPTTTGAYSFETGRLGKALRLLSTNNGYVAMPVEVFQGATDITIATWIKVTTSSAAIERIFDLGIDAKGAQNQQTGTVYMTFMLSDPFSTTVGEHSFSSTTNGYTNAKKVVAPPSAIPSNTWKHVAVTLSGGTATLYIDGASVGAPATVPTPMDLGAIDYAYIGRSQFTDDPYLDALIDEFRVYNRALPAVEVQALFQLTP